MLAAEYFASSTISRDFWGLITGAMIGEGMSREVYACTIRDDLVVKVEHRAQHFQNVIEWETWNRVRRTECAKWFAPCVNISPCGTILLQRRTTPAPKKSYPDKLPAFFTDHKLKNWGLLDGRLVCHDYGTHLMLENGMTKRMAKVHHWTGTS